MTLEEQLFQKKQPNTKKLLSYGFQKKKNQYVYRQTIMDGQFEAEIIISKDGVVSGKLMDLDLNEEYVLIHTTNPKGFAHEVRSAYLDLLENIAKNCFQEVLFASPQANRIASYILSTYHDEPDIPWKDGKGGPVFRNPDSKKWYALIMPVEGKKLDAKRSKDLVDVMNIKVDQKNLHTYLSIPGIYPAYHMNKGHWLSLVLDDTLTDAQIYPLLDESHHFTIASSPHLSVHDWLVPANPKYYDVLGNLKRYKKLTWHIRKKMAVDDTIYIYYAAPYSAIVARCKVIARGSDGATTLALKQVYAKNALPLQELKKHGLTTVRFTTRVPLETITFIQPYNV